MYNIPIESIKSNPAARPPRILTCAASAIKTGLSIVNAPPQNPGN